MPTELENDAPHLSSPRPDAAMETPELSAPSDETRNEDAPDDTPEYPLAAPMKPDDPERRSDQSKAETAGLVEEDLPAALLNVKQARPSFKLALGSAVLIAISLGFELGRQFGQRR